MTKVAIYQGNTPPSMEHVKTYFSQKGMNEREAEHFYLFYQMKQWRSSKGNLLTNWKSPAYRWIMAAIRLQPELFNRAIY